MEWLFLKVANLHMAHREQPCPCDQAIHSHTAWYSCGEGPVATTVCERLRPASLSHSAVSQIKYLLYPKHFSFQVCPYWQLLTVSVIFCHLIDLGFIPFFLKRHLGTTVSKRCHGSAEKQVWTQMHDSETDRISKSSHLHLKHAKVKTK